MKRILFALVLLCVGNMLHAQYVYTIKADSVKITNSCDTAELIIENHSQMVPGFLFNKGRGRTEFRRIAQLDDTLVVIGGDTIHLGRGSKNFANADLTFDGDHIHDGALHSVNLNNFSNIGFHVNSAAGTETAEMTMVPRQGYSLNLANTADPNSLKTGTYNMSYREFYTEVNTTTTDLSKSASYGLGNGTLYLSVNESYLNTGEFSNAGIAIAYPEDYDPRHLDIYNENGYMHLWTWDKFNGKRIDLNFKDSVTTYTGGGDGATTLEQTHKEFRFSGGAIGGHLGFKLFDLPVSTNPADSILVIDENSQVKRRPLVTARKSATITADTYTVPADVDVVFVNCASSTATISLPSGTLDREITIKNLNSTNSVALSGLDSSESNTIATRGAITVKYTGSAWVGISKY